MLKKYFFLVVFIVFALNTNILYAQSDDSSSIDDSSLTSSPYYEELKTLENKMSQSKLIPAQEMIEIYKKLGDVYYKIARTYYLKEPQKVTFYCDQANKYYNLAFNQIDKIKDKLFLINILNDIGKAQLQEYYIFMAQDKFTKALSYAESIKNNDKILEIYNNMIDLYIQQGDYPTAKAYIDKTLILFKSLNKTADETPVLLKLANVLRETGKFDQARDNYIKVIDITKNDKDKYLYAKAMLNLSILQNKMGDYNNASDSLIQATQIFNTLKDQTQLAQCFLTSGDIIYFRSLNKGIVEQFIDHVKSLQIYQQSIQLAIESRAYDTFVYGQNRLMDCYRNLYYDLTNKDIRESLIHTSKSKDKSKEVTDLLNQITSQEFINQMDKEINKYISTNSYNIDLITNTYNVKRGIPDLYTENGDNYFFLKNYDKAIENYKIAIELDKQISSTDLWLVYYKLAKTYEQAKSPNNALNIYQLAVEAVNDISNNINSEADKVKYKKMKQSLYRDYSNLKKDLGDVSGAMEIMDLANLSEQADLIMQNTSDKKLAGDSPKTKLLNQALETKNKASEISRDITIENQKPDNLKDTHKINDLNNQLKKAREEFQKTTLQIQEQFPDLLKYVAVKPSNIRTLQTLLPADAVIVEPVIFEDKVLIFVAPPGSKQPVYKEIKISANEIFKSILDFRRNIAEPSQKQNLLNASTSLYNTFIKPIEADISGYKTLVVCPYENLRYIPFQALYDGKHFLVENYAIVNITSASALKIGNQKPMTQENILAFGNATEDLPAAEEEVNDIASIFKSTKVYTRNNALKNTFDEEINNDFNVIHLATHGILNSDEPERSRLLFAGKDNNSLSVGEILGYDFSTKDLVVLSACNSNIGKAKGAEVSSLCCAFEMAAAPSVIASLWKVNDNSTSLLMNAFYRNLSHGQSKAEALKNAQISLIKDPKYNNPYYWSPFILMGTWK